MGIRDAINQKPMLGWIVAGVLGLVAVFFIFRSSFTGGERPSIPELKRTITIRDVETGDTWTMTRGELERQLYIRANKGELDMSVGFVNPETGKPTGFPELRGGWEDLVERIQTEVEEAKAKRGG